MKRILRLGLLFIASLGLAGCHAYGSYTVIDYHHSYHGHGHGYHGGYPRYRHGHGGHHYRRHPRRHHH